MGVTADQHGNVYVSDTGRVRKIDSTGTITTLAGPIVRFAGGFPSLFSGLSVDSAGNIYVAESGTSLILKVSRRREASRL